MYSPPRIIREGDGLPPKKPRKIPQRKPWDSSMSPTAMRALSPAEQAAVDANAAQLAQARKAKRVKRGHTSGRTFSGVSQAQVAEMIERYQAGATMKAVAEAVGFSRTTVNKYLELNEVPIRGGRQKATDHTAEAVRLYATGISMREVGKQLGIANTTVRVLLREAGVPARGQGEWRRLRREAS